jgi:hypothetical protein
MRFDPLLVNQIRRGDGGQGSTARWMEMGWWQLMIVKVFFEQLRHRGALPFLQAADRRYAL